jgi:flagellar motor switch protein FliN/FliY
MSGKLTETAGWLPFPSAGSADPAFHVGVTVNVEGLPPFALHLLLRLADAKALAGKIRDALAPAGTPAPAASPRPASTPSVPTAAAPTGFAPPVPAAPPVDVRPAEFQPIQPQEVASLPGNIDLVIDIPVRVTVELGRTRRTIGEILGMGPGSVVELNKMAGEPVDLLVNGKLIARGEVVVIDESFGVRVTEIVSRAERIRSMGM